MDAGRIREALLVGCARTCAALMCSVASASAQKRRAERWRQQFLHRHRRGCVNVLAQCGVCVVWGVNAHTSACAVVVPVCAACVAVCSVK